MNQRFNLSPKNVIINIEIKMARKIINQGEYSLHVVASEGGVIIVKVFNRESSDLLECSIFTEQSEALTDYISQFTTKTKSILNFLNTL